MTTEQQTCTVKQWRYRYPVKLTTVVLLFMFAFQAIDAEARKRGGHSYRSSSTYTMPSTPTYKPAPVITPTPHRSPRLDFIPTPARATPAKPDTASSPAFGDSIPSPTALVPLARPMSAPAAANPITTAASSTSSNPWLLGTAGSIGFGGFLWLLFRRRREPSPPSDPLDQLLEKINQQWHSYSKQQKKTIQELKIAHTKEFLSRDDLKIQLEKVL